MGGEESVLDDYFYRMGKTLAQMEKMRHERADLSQRMRKFPEFFPFIETELENVDRYIERLELRIIELEVLIEFEQNS